MIQFDAFSNPELSKSIYSLFLYPIVSYNKWMEGYKNSQFEDSNIYHMMIPTD